jgi:hypothetical protein
MDVQSVGEQLPDDMANRIEIDSICHAKDKIVERPKKSASVEAHERGAPTTLPDLRTLSRLEKDPSDQKATDAEKELYASRGAESPPTGREMMDDDGCDSERPQGIHLQHVWRGATLYCQFFNRSRHVSDPGFANYTSLH